MNRKIIILGIPVCLGAPLAGCAQGPDVIRKQLTESQIEFEDYGDLVKAPIKCKSKKCVSEINSIYKKTTAILSKFFIHSTAGKFLPILIGGDHSMNYSFIRESAMQTKRKAKAELGLIWFDAHGDFNTPETTITGNVHGMVLATLAGKNKLKPIIKEENICLFGVRDLDPKEEELLNKTKVNVITAHQIKKTGITKALKQAVKKLPKHIHLSFDLDFFDPRTAPGVNTPSIKGFSQKHLTQISKFFCHLKNKKITSIDIMEFNPKRDKKNKTASLVQLLIEKISQ